MADTPMRLLTWHGTLVCLREDGSLLHLPLPLAADAPPPLQVALTDEGAVQPHPELGGIATRPSPLGRGLCLMRDGRFLCAEAHQKMLAFDRDAANIWEIFLPVSAGDLADLQQVLRHAWINRPTRQVIRRRTIRLSEEFRLQIGGATLDLTRLLPLPRPADAPDPELPVRHLLIPQTAGTLELVIAEPRSSALLTTALWPVRGRRVAEMLALASHRHLLGQEPEQDVFEADVAFLEANGGPAALADLLESLPAPPPAANTAAMPAHSPACPIVSLGTICIVAATLQRIGPGDRPMPFDWLGATPAMIRHCIETDFAELLDQTQYVSLTGKPSFGHPHEGAEHAFYLREFRVPRVFNHADPTQKAAYRYLQSCVDRFRDLMASADAKLFVQVQEPHGQNAQDFAATAALLDGATQESVFVQIVVFPPDRKRAMPLLALAERRGAHVLYHLHPVSQMSGEKFERQVDNDFFAALLSAHAQRPAAGPATAAADRADLQDAIAGFGTQAPADPQAKAATRAASLIERANVRLHGFLSRTGLPRRFRFGMFDSRQLSLATDPAPFLVEISSMAATLRIDPTRANLWQALQHSLGLIYLLDIVFAAEPVADARFVAELESCGTLPRSVAFHSRHASACLIPDPAFFATGGYDGDRRAIAADRTAWSDRQPAPPLARIETQAPPSAFLGLKAMLLPGGDTQAGRTLFCALLSGACVLKAASAEDCRPWYYEDLKPWVHFVPVADDFGDLDDILAWLQAHDDDARAIGEAGRAFAKTLTFEATVADAAERLRNAIARSRGAAL
jgi:hypothetical protein